MDAPAREGRRPSLETRVSGRCRINVLGSNRLFNELLAAFLADALRGVCGGRRACLRIDLVDCRELDFPERWVRAAERLPPCSAQRVLACFNVPEDTPEATEREALARGVRGLFYRSDSRETIAKGVRSIVGGEVWYRRTSLYRLATGAAPASAPPAAAPERAPAWIALLTGREREILGRLATGAGNQEIADALHVSLHTVKTHLYRIFRKIGARSRHQATLWGIEHGLVALPPPAGRGEAGARSVTRG